MHQLYSKTKIQHNQLALNRFLNKNHKINVENAISYSKLVFNLIFYYCIKRIKVTLALCSTLAFLSSKRLTTSCLP